MSSFYPIKIYGKQGPNPPKILMVCEELGLPYEAKELAFEELKKPDYLVINPNGLMPAIYDPTPDIPYGSRVRSSSIWSRISGQGPYYGQAVWFTKFYPEKLESVQQRYYNEIKRVTSVLERHLKEQAKGTDGPWLVGNKFSYADLSFIPWQNSANSLMKEWFDLSEFAEANGWLKRMNNKPAIKVVLGS